MKHEDRRQEEEPMDWEDVPFLLEVSAHFVPSRPPWKMRSLISVQVSEPPSLSANRFPNMRALVPKIAAKKRSQWTGRMFLSSLSQPLPQHEGSRSEEDRRRFESSLDVTNAFRSTNNVYIITGYSIDPSGRNSSGGRGRAGRPLVILRVLSIINWGGIEPNRTVTCMVLKATDNDRRHLALCHDECCGPRSGLYRLGGISNNNSLKRIKII
ncbi:uncharacterized protein TNCV_2246401 [Trichonephila clavipes]|nr:uncharacterized protein TNCV_2246401 [Trichonephila clavipes]